MNTEAEKNADSYPHWDWSTDYMCTLSFWGNMEEQPEGTTLRIRNTGDEQKIRPIWMHLILILMAARRLRKTTRYCH